MTYDAADDYVVEYGGNPSNTCDCISPINETWTFAHGSWTRLDTFNPDVNSMGTMAYDQSSGEVVLFGGHQNRTGSINPTTWAFSGGVWTQLHPKTSPNVGDTGSGAEVMAWDGSAQTVALVHANSTWLLENGSWQRVESLPYLSAGFNGFAWDAKEGYDVLFGSTIPPWDTSLQLNITWVFTQGRWENASINGPPTLGGDSLVFDAYDGYLLLFGGGGLGSTVNKSVLPFSSETWIYTTPSIRLVLSLVAHPAVICSTASENCGVGTDETSLTLTVAAVAATPNATYGVDDGQGNVSWGPYFWVMAPELSFVGWGNLLPATPLNDTYTCHYGTATRVGCTAVPTVTSLGRAGSLLTWNLSGSGPFGAVAIGDTWSLTFESRAFGSPFGAVPVDACTTEVCHAQGIGMVDGWETGLSFTPYDNQTRVSVSGPLGTVTVLPPTTPTTPPPSVAPPPPPIGVGTPLPTPSPSVPTPAPTPVASPSVAQNLLLGSGVSISSLAAGVLGAGVASATIRRTGQRVPIAMRARAAGRRKDRVRGED